MKLITYKSIAFLLKISAENCLENSIVINANKNLTLFKTATLTSQQKSIDFSISEEGFFNFFKNTFLNYILVGKNKSVVTYCKMKGPTPDILQKFCYD